MSRVRCRGKLLPDFPKDRAFASPRARSVLRLWTAQPGSGAPVDSGGSRPAGCEMIAGHQSALGRMCVLRDASVDSSPPDSVRRDFGLLAVAHEFGEFLLCRHHNHLASDRHDPVLDVGGDQSALALS
jgi:hypothetical protein